MTPAIFLLLMLTTTPELSPGVKVPDAARPGPTFDVERATLAYLDLLSPEQRARSDAYFEGGYWLELWGLLYTLGIAALLLFTGWSRRMRELAQRIAKRPFFTSMLYAVLFLLSLFVLSLPIDIYTDFVREHQYGLATQTFGPWFVDQLKGLLVGMIFLPIIVAAIYAAVRKTGERWWIWASWIALFVTVFVTAIAPVAIAPLFNKYTTLPAGPVRDSILSMARANRIPAHDVYLFDASRQTTRVSANVSGLFGTTRISLNDNLLNRTSLPEIRAVLGHEMGHYVLNHGVKLIIETMLVVVLGFWIVHRAFDRAHARWGARFGIADRADPAGLPLAMAIFALFFFFATPVTNTIGRTAEAEADAFGINASGEPHGFATTALRLSTYRKLKPSRLEEIIFYDHPSGYDRIRRAMSWLKEHPSPSPQT